MRKALLILTLLCSALSLKAKVETFRQDGDLVIVKQGLKFGVTDTAGNVIVSPNYKAIDEFNVYGVAKVKTMKNVDGYLTSAGMFFTAYQPNENGYCIIRNSDARFGVMDSLQQVVVEPRFINYCERNGMDMIQTNNAWAVEDAAAKYGVIDVSQNGREIVPIMYDALKLTEDICLVQKGGVWGCWRDSIMLVRPQYQDVSNGPYKAGIGVRKNSLWYVHNFNSGDDSSGYPILLDVVEADSCHGGQLYAMGSIAGRDTSYVILNANLEQVCPITLKSADKAKSVLVFFRHKPVEEWTDLYMRRLRLQLSADERKYDLKDVIREDDWDF